MSKQSDSQRILILDFGSQYTQLIARRVREMAVYCEIHSWQMSAEQIQAFQPNGIILSGGPGSTSEPASPRAADIVFQLGVPVLGICYGMQSMALQLGGQVTPAQAGEFGYAVVKLKKPSFLLQGIEDSLNAQGEALLEVWMSHGDQVTKIPEGFVTLASSRDCRCAVMADESRHLYGIQFHPEVTHTLQGQRILSRFVRDICACEALWTPKAIIDEAVASIQQQVGEDQVILGLSGGVDSSVTALLLHRAIGQQLICVFVDNGLLRLDEGQQIIQSFGEHFGLNLVAINAEERFLTALQGISDPEAKRKVIGHEFIRVFEKQAAQQTRVKWLAQGTIYPDIIESAATATGQAVVIKSHHNVGGLPDAMQLKLLEPLKTLFKDEVRQLGLALGLPYDMLYRHPFPGPGLGVRVMGEVKKEYCDLLRRADAIFMQALHQAKLYYKVSQAFAVFLPVRSVGVMGDNRRYDWIIALRAVETSDFMTARWAQLPYEFLAHVANRIVNEVAGISRVVYDISGKPPATIEWE